MDRFFHLLYLDDLERDVLKRSPVCNDRHSILFLYDPAFFFPYIDTPYSYLSLVAFMDQALSQGSEALALICYLQLGQQLLVTDIFYQASS